MRRTAVVVMALLVLGACGGGNGSGATPDASTTPSDGSPAGTAAPEALSDVTCEQRDEAWTATGVVSNDTDEDATYQVTVYVGDASGGEGEARTERIGEVAAGKSVTFDVDDIPDGDGPCRIQVVVLDQSGSP